MSTIVIPKLEQGVIRVFAISRPISEMSRLLESTDKHEVATGLLNHPVEADMIELIALPDLAGVGLHGYLSEGYGVDTDALNRDAGRLDALDGYVLLLFSNVSAAQEVTLVPAAELTLIGTYAEPKPVNTAAPIVTPSAALYSGPKSDVPAPPRTRIGSIATGLAALLTLFLIWWIAR